MPHPQGVLHESEGLHTDLKQLREILEGNLAKKLDQLLQGQQLLSEKLEVQSKPTQDQKIFSHQSTTHSSLQSQHSSSCISLERFSSIKNDPGDPQEAAQDTQGALTASGSKILSRQFRTIAREVGSSVTLGSSLSNSVSEVSKMERVREFVRGPLDLLAGFIVICNSLLMRQALASLGLTEEGAGGFFRFYSIVDIVFLAIYALELCIRILALGPEFLHSDEGGFAYVNVFDLLIVTLGVAEAIINSVSQILNGAPNLALLRVLRALRALKAFRLARLSSLFRQLRILVDSILASLSALFWSLFFLLLLQWLTVLVLCQTMHPYIVDEQKDWNDRYWLYTRFGNFWRAMYTMFEFTYSGGWPGVARPTMERTNDWIGLVFLAYVLFVNFAIMKIITSLFIKETLRAAEADTHNAVQERMLNSQKFFSKLTELFNVADLSADGVLTRKELETAMSHRTFQHYLDLMGIRVHESRRLFDILDEDGNGVVTVDEFCAGLRHSMGEARALDIMDILRRCLLIQHRLDNLILNVA